MLEPEAPQNSPLGALPRILLQATEMELVVELKVWAGFAYQMEMVLKPDVARVVVSVE